MSSTSATSSPTEPLQEYLHRASSLLAPVKKLLSCLVYFILLMCKLIEQVISFFVGNPNPKELLSTSLFTSLPEDITLNILACVPRRDYPVVSCVSKSFRSLMLSPDFANMRSVLGKDHFLFYVCFKDQKYLRNGFHWFTFNQKEKQTSDHSNSTDQVLSQQKMYCSNVSIGSKIYFVGGCKDQYSAGLRIFDSLSNKLCTGPPMKMSRTLPGVAVVDGKIYVMGGSHARKAQVEVFDPKTQIWKVAPLCPNGKELRENTSVVTEALALKGMFYGMSYRQKTHIYNTKNGRCVTIDLSNVDSCRRGRLCVINNLMYAYSVNHGLMWFASKYNEWREVKGLKRLDNTHDMALGMVDCNGKVGIVREDLRDIIAETTEKRIWCTIIVLDRIGEDQIYGKIEGSESCLVGSVPSYYQIWRCLSVPN